MPRISDPIAIRQAALHPPFSAATSLMLGAPSASDHLFDKVDRGDRSAATLDEAAARLATDFYARPFPMLRRSRTEWVRRFGLVGYTLDGYRLDFLRRHADDPRLAREALRAPVTSAVRLYRTALPEYRHGLSWTPSRSLALAIR